MSSYVFKKIKNGTSSIEKREHNSLGLLEKS